MPAAMRKCRKVEQQQKKIGCSSFSSNVGKNRNDFCLHARDTLAEPNDTFYDDFFIHTFFMEIYLTKICVGQVCGISLTTF